MVTIITEVVVISKGLLFCTNIIAVVIFIIKIPILVIVIEVFAEGVTSEACIVRTTRIPLTGAGSVTVSVVHAVVSPAVRIVVTAKTHVVPTLCSSFRACSITLFKLLKTFASTIPFGCVNNILSLTHTIALSISFRTFSIAREIFIGARSIAIIKFRVNI